MLPDPVHSRVRLRGMVRVVVDVMPKPEILDPQGKAVTGALARLGFAGMSVRQGKRFELELDGEVTEERLAEVRRAAETLLANTVIETFDVRVEPAPESAGEDDDQADDDPSGEDEAQEEQTEPEEAELATQAR
jgi:phosphoribosylformylglycinamidine synthase subunit PurS